MTQSTRTPAPTCRGLHSAETSVSSEQVDIYGAPFWSAYAANFLVSIGVAILIRYGDFITLLGGTELHLGWIVGIGMVGSMAMRLAMGAGIDSYGPRLVWLGSVALFVVMCLAHLAITSPTGMPIYLLRVGYCCAIAGIYGASMTFVSSRTPMTRIAEIVGMLGTAGFIGNMVGTQLGDHLRNSGPMDRWQMDQMFLVAAMFGLCSMPVSWLAMRGRSHPAPATHQPMFRLLRKYHPGMLLLVVVAMGSALNLPFTFLPTYAAELGIPRIALFFTVYSIDARPDRLGRRRVGQEPFALASSQRQERSEKRFNFGVAAVRLLLQSANGCQGSRDLEFRIAFQVVERERPVVAPERRNERDAPGANLLAQGFGPRQMRIQRS